MHTCHLICKIIFWKHYFAYFFEIFRLVFPKPQNLWCCKSCKCDICCIFCYFIFTYSIVKIITFFCCSAIIPKYRRSYYFIVLIKNYKPMHLSAEADACNLCRINSVCKLFYSLNCIFIPV